MIGLLKKNELMFKNIRNDKYMWQRDEDDNRKKIIYAVTHNELTDFLENYKGTNKKILFKIAEGERMEIENIINDKEYFNLFFENREILKIFFDIPQLFLKFSSSPFLSNFIKKNDWVVKIILKDEEYITKFLHDKVLSISLSKNSYFMEQKCNLGSYKDLVKYHTESEVGNN